MFSFLSGISKSIFAEYHSGYNKSLKHVQRFALHWTASVGAFASQIVCAVLRCRLALR
jgi:hypothetical protein